MESGQGRHRTAKNARPNRHRWMVSAPWPVEQSISAAPAPHREQRWGSVSRWASRSLMLVSDSGEPVVMQLAPDQGIHRISILAGIQLRVRTSSWLSRYFPYSFRSLSPWFLTARPLVGGDAKKSWIACRQERIGDGVHEFDVVPRGPVSSVRALPLGAVLVGISVSGVSGSPADQVACRPCSPIPFAPPLTRPMGGSRRPFSLKAPLPERMDRLLPVLAFLMVGNMESRPRTFPGFASFPVPGRRQGNGSRWSNRHRRPGSRRSWALALRRVSVGMRFQG